MGLERVKPEPKHRYFQFAGNRKQVHEMKKKLAYPIIDQYPKCAATRYDDGPLLTEHFYPEWLR